MSGTALRRDIFAVAQSGLGDVALAFEEESLEPGNAYDVRHTLFLATRTPEGSWKMTGIDSCLEAGGVPFTSATMQPFFAGGLAMEGQTNYLFSYHDVSDVQNVRCKGENGDAPPGLWGRRFAPDGSTGDFEAIDEGALGVNWIVAREHSKLGLAVAYTGWCSHAEEDWCLYVHVHSGTPAIWQKNYIQLTIPANAFLWDMEIVDGEPTVLIADGETLATYRHGSTSPTSSKPYPIVFEPAGGPHRTGHRGLEGGGAPVRGPVLWQSLPDVHDRSAPGRVVALGRRDLERRGREGSDGARAPRRRAARFGG
jgi:hypothetical protein